MKLGLVAAASLCVASGCIWGNRSERRGTTTSTSSADANTAGGPQGATGTPSGSSGGQDPSNTGTSGGGGTSGSGGSGGSSGGSSGGTGGSSDGVPVAYGGAVHSPITSYVRDRLRAIRAQATTRSETVFMIAGNTNAAQVLSCADPDGYYYTKPGPVYGAHDDVRNTVTKFMAGRIVETRTHNDVNICNIEVGTTTPLARCNLTTVETGQAQDVLESLGSGCDGAGQYPCTGSRFDLEAATTNAAYAFIQFGGIEQYASCDDNGHCDEVAVFGPALLHLIDGAEAQGMVPLVMTTPLNSDPDPSLEMSAVVNAIIREAAEARQVPLADLERFLRDNGAPNAGMEVSSQHESGIKGSNHAICDFSDSGLKYGLEAHAFLSFQQLGRVSSALEGQAPDTGTERTLAGQGTAADPFVITALPFARLRPTPSGDEVYRFSLTSSQAVSLIQFDKQAGAGQTTVTLHAGSPQGAATAIDTHVRKTLAAGDYYLVVQASSPAAGSEYLVGVVP